MLQDISCACRQGRDHGSQRTAITFIATQNYALELHSIFLVLNVQGLPVFVPFAWRNMYGNKCIVK